MYRKRNEKKTGARKSKKEEGAKINQSGNTEADLPGYINAIDSLSFFFPLFTPLSFHFPLHFFPLHFVSLPSFC